MPKYDDLVFLGRVKGMMTFKEQERAQLLKQMVHPASELAKRKQEELDRSKEFTRAAEDEGFYKRTETSASPRDHSPIGRRVGVITREPFEELP